MTPARLVRAGEAGIDTRDHGPSPRGRYSGMAQRRIGLGWVGLLAAACWAASLVPVGAATAQTTTAITGTVRDAAGGEPIAGARVAALRTTDYGLAGGAEAGPDGAFALTGLPEGSYFLYLFDPAGRHRAAFHGAPATVTVTTGATTAVAPTLAPLRGGLTGTVTEDGSGVPVAGAWVLVLAAATGRLVTGTTTAADGSFAVSDLRSGDHWVVIADPRGRHQPEFFDDSPGPVDAATVSTLAGATTTITASLAASTPPDRHASLTGAVIEEGTGDALPQAWVIALDATTFTMVGGTAVAPDGRYELAVSPGRYLVGFLDPTGDHPMRWHAGVDQTDLGDATPVEVADTATVDAQLPATTGTLRGTVREDESHDPVPGAWTVAIGPTEVRVVNTAADGTFAFADLPAGTYRAAFVDPASGRQVEFWDGATAYEGATPVAVPAGGEASVETSLTPPRCGQVGAPDPCLPAFPLPVAGPGWSRYDIAAGAHSATVTRGASATAPKAGFSTASGRRYHFVFDQSAAYVLTNPTQPEDQFDWNKLPGLSDCGQLDLSQDGWMFGWRWRTDLSPTVLEVTAYANNAGTHLTPPTPLLTLTAEQLGERVPVWFELGISADRRRYEFRVAGPGRRSASTTLPRRCTATSTSTFKWASGFYFGGTSTAPTSVRGWTNEP